MPLTLFSEEISRTSNQHLSPALKRTVIKNATKYQSLKAHLVIHGRHQMQRHL